MIGKLLKELIAGLWRFFRYHLARLTGPERGVPIPQVTQNQEPSIPLEQTGADLQLPDEEILSDRYLRPVRMSTSRKDLDDGELALNPVFQLWRQQKPHAHKWTHYFEAYHGIFGARRSEALRILEIGVQTGASLRIWKGYFDHPETVIVGIDIDPSCAELDSPREKVHVRIGNQADGAFLESVTREFGPFDIVIDDGSHQSSHLIQSFNHLFAVALKDDGVYLAEDLHAEYWPAWRDRRRSFLDLAKELMDFMHSHYTKAAFPEWLSESESESRPLSMEVPTVTTMIREIRVFDSIVAIHKTRRKYLPRLLNPTAD